MSAKDLRENVFITTESLPIKAGRSQGLIYELPARLGVFHAIVLRHMIPADLVISKDPKSPWRRSCSRERLLPKHVKPTIA